MIINILGVNIKCIIGFWVNGDFDFELFNEYYVIVCVIDVKGFFIVE